MHVYVLVCVILALLYYLKIWKPHQYYKERGIDHIKPWPIIGSLTSNILKNKAFAEELESLCSKMKDKRFFGVYQMLVPSMIIHDPELIKTLTVKHFDHFLDHQNFIPETDAMWQKNLVALKGDKWREMRNTLSPAFTSSKMRAMFNLILDCSEKYAKHFINKKEKVIALELKEMFTKFTTDAIATTAFGLENDSINEENNEFYKKGQEATDLTGFGTLMMMIILALSPALSNFLNLKLFSKEVTNFFRKIIKDAMDYREEHKIVRPDMLQLLMDAKKGKLKHEDDVKENESNFAATLESEAFGLKRESKLVITDEDITAQCLLFFFGGFDSVSTLMCHMAYELALNPDIQSKLQQEVDDTLSTCKGKVTYDALMHMKYMDMVVSETLRKWPPSSMTDRLCTKSFTIEPEREGEKPVIIEKNTAIFLPVYWMHRNPDYFPDPENFDPERFSDENKSSIKPFTYIPFGMGPRSCIGSRLALMENKAIFFSLLTHFNFVPVEKTKNPLVLSKKHFNMMAEGGFWVGLEARKKNE